MSDFNVYTLKKLTKLAVAKKVRFLKFCKIKNPGGIAFNVKNFTKFFPRRRKEDRLLLLSWE